LGGLRSLFRLQLKSRAVEEKPGDWKREPVARASIFNDINTMWLQIQLGGLSFR
jgi:hypothetical protein